jgi:gamma-glutamyltranspeptidase/glutathione hydrolase
LRRFLAAALIALLGCSGELPPVRLQIGEGTAAPAPRFEGLVAADEPEAALSGAALLRNRGNAADAAVAVGLALAVTLPSRAGLDGGGLCLVRDAASRAVEAIDFRNDADGSGSGLARGLYALHARYGRIPWAQTVAPAEALARFGVTVSRALADDVAAYGSALLADRTAFAAFTTPRRQLLAAGDVLVQRALAATLGEARARGGVDLGRAAAPRWRAADRTAGPDAEAFSVAIPGAGSDPAVGTSFALADPSGGAVACALSLGAAFGTGHMIPDRGVLRASAASAPAVAATVILSSDTAEPRAAWAVAGNDGAVVAAVTVALRPRATLSDLREAAEAAAAGAHPMNGWFCGQDIKIDGAACAAASGRTGSALVLVPGSN